MKKTITGKHLLHTLIALAVGGWMGLTHTSCTEEDSTWDPYHNWQARNTEWYRVITDSARTAIAKAKAQYGTAWEEHCEWRQYKSLLLSAQYDTRDYTDSVCVHIVKRSTATDQASPHYNDSVRVSYRGYLMPTSFQHSDGTFYTRQPVFTQTYYGDFDERTASPSLMAVSGVVEGFNTALQYMKPGDDWKVYIPQKMAYGANAKDAIPAYSTLLFRIHLDKVYAPGKVVK